MAKQTINLGTTPNKGDGDPLRTAFRKINENFDELYSGAASELGAFEFGGSTITTTDSSDITIAQNVTITSDLTMSGDIVPAADNAYDLGSPTQQWRSLYLTGNTVYFNGVPLSVTDDGTLIIDGQVAATPGGATTWDSVTNKPTFADVATSGSYDDLTDKPTIPSITGLATEQYVIDAVGAVVIPDVSNFITAEDIPAIPADISDLTDTTNLLGSGGGSITVGNGTGTSVENVTEILINGTITEIEPGLVGVTISGSTTQPYLELTNTPFITQPAILGTPVTVNVPVTGINAQVQVDISEGPVLGGITVITPGTGYVPGQRYIIYSYQIGGNNDATSSITLTIDTVDVDGGILTVTDAAFTGAATNNPASYNVSIDYQPTQIFDEIGPGLTLTRDLNQGIYNSEAEPEYDNITYLSPLGTEWNADGWSDLVDLGTRSYTTWRSALNNQVGNNIVASELVMHDTINDKYYKFDFTAWGGNNGGYAYTRTLVEDPNYFKKDDYATANNVDVIEDDSTLQIGITRGNNNGIYNPFTEEDWDQNVSPQGTLWNIDGWDDLSDVETRTYTNFYAAYGNGQLGNRVPGSKAVMYVPSIEKYYAIQWLSWTQNNVGGGFSYTRKEIDLTKLNEGIKFPDGTLLKSAEGIGRVKSTAVGDRRIEEVTGFNQVSVTARVTNNYTGLTSINSNGYELRVARTEELDAILQPINQGSVNATFTLSYDNITYRAVWLSSIQQTEYWFYYEVDNGQTTPQTQGDTVYLRVTSGADPATWWNKADLPGGSDGFRGAVIDYHAYTGDSTIIGTIHIVDDDGEEHISHQEVQSGSPDGENDDLWYVTSEGQIKYRRIDGESATLKIHWTAKVFYGSELYD